MRRTSKTFNPYFFRISSSTTFFPITGDLGLTFILNKLSASWYSLTSSFRDLFLFVLLLLFCPFLERNILLNGISTIIPVRTQMIPTGVKEKKERGAYPFSVSVF